MCILLGVHKNLFYYYENKNIISKYICQNELIEIILGIKKYKNEQLFDPFQ